MKYEITGIDGLLKELSDVERAVKSLSGTITTLSFDPASPESVAAAILEMERAVDAKIGTNRSNPLVRNLVAEMKAAYRAQIQRVTA